MFKFSEWEQLYKQILALLLTNKKIKNLGNIISLLENLNSDFFYYSSLNKLSLDLDDQEKLTLTDNLINSIDALKQTFIKNDKNISDNLQQMDASIKNNYELIKSKGLTNALIKSIKKDDFASTKKLFLAIQSLPTNTMDEIKKNMVAQIILDHKEESEIKILHQLGINFDMILNSGATPLIEAISQGNINLIKLLINSGATPNYPNENGYSPIYFTTSPQIIKILLASGASIWDLLTKNETKEILEIFNDSLINIDETIKKNLLSRAINQKKMQFAKVLLNSGAYSEDIVKVAIYQEDDSLINFITENMTNPELLKKILIPKPLNLEKFKLLVELNLSLQNYSLDFNDLEIDLLQTPKAIEILLENIPPDKIKTIKYPYKQTSWPNDHHEIEHFIARYAHHQSMALFINKGLDINKKDKEGLTPLHYAAMFSNEDVVKLLILAGADINACDNNGMTPLHWATKYQLALADNNIECVRILLYAGADATILNKDKKTALECLCTGGCYGLARKKAWEKAYQTEKKQFIAGTKLAQKRNPESTIPSLFQISACFFATSNELTKDLKHRREFSIPLAEHIEEIGLEELTPPKKEFNL